MTLERIPVDTLSERKYLRWTGPLSKTRDKLTRHGNEKDSPTPLSHAKVLGIEDSITHSDGFATQKACFRPLPVLSFNGVIDPKESADEATEGVVFGAEYSWDVFPNCDSW